MGDNSYAEIISKGKSKALDSFIVKVLWFNILPWDSLSYQLVQLQGYVTDTSVCRNKL